MTNKKQKGTLKVEKKSGKTIIIYNHAIEKDINGAIKVFEGNELELHKEILDKLSELNYMRTQILIEWRECSDLKEKKNLTKDQKLITDKMKEMGKALNILSHDIMKKAEVYTKPLVTGRPQGASKKTLAKYQAILDRWYEEKDAYEKADINITKLYKEIAKEFNLDSAKTVSTIIHTKSLAEGLIPTPLK